jgi:hypothetical protein
MDTSTTINASAFGQQVGAFLNQAGPHDLLMNNPLDRDAGQYKALYGQNRWWDRLNVTYPNFRRWEQYLQATGAADANKSMLLWQVPVGNQYFDNENNTNNHYQDNRPEYIFGHVSELIQNGIIGAVFASGNAGNTTYTDADHDGIINPASFCTTDGVSSGQICNNHTATVADDDGGYVRVSAQNYYLNPVPLTSTSATPTPTATATVAATYTSSATVTPSSVAASQNVSIVTSVSSSQASTVLVDVEVYDPASAKVFQQSWDNQAFSAGRTQTYTSSWTPSSTAAAGTYTVKVGVFTPGWGSLLAWNNGAATFSVSAAAAATNTPTPLPPTNTPTPLPTSTPLATSTSTPTAVATNTPLPTSTAVLTPTPTATPKHHPH